MASSSHPSWPILFLLPRTSSVFDRAHLIHIAYLFMRLGHSLVILVLVIGCLILIPCIRGARLLFVHSPLLLIVRFRLSVYRNLPDYPAQCTTQRRLARLTSKASDSQTIFFIYRCQTQVQSDSNHCHCLYFGKNRR